MKEKITIGGLIGYKIQIAQYEPTEVTATVQIETEIDSDDEIQALEEKLNVILKKQVNERAKLAITNYKENIKKYKKLVD